MSSLNPDLPRNPNPKEGETSIIIYGYIPSLSLGLACTIIFGIFCVAHLVFGVFDARLFRRHRHGRAGLGPTSADTASPEQELAPTDFDSPSGQTGQSKVTRAAKDADIRIFSFLIAFGSAMEAVGYAFRVRSHYNPFLLNAFILQYFMIVCAPVLYTAAIYLGLATILRTNPALQRMCPIGPRLLIALFVIADTITIVMQVAGAALFGVAQSKIADNETPPLSPQAANNILTAGLAVQTFFFTIFLAVFGTFVFNVHRNKRRHEHGTLETEKDATALKDQRRLGTVGPDKLLLAVMAVSSFFIYLRTIFRLAEAIEGVYSKTATDEGFFAALEATPVLVAIFVWTVVPLGWRIRKRAL